MFEEFGLESATNQKINMKTLRSIKNVISPPLALLSIVFFISFFFSLHQLLFTSSVSLHFISLFFLLFFSSTIPSSHFAVSPNFLSSLWCLQDWWLKFAHLFWLLGDKLLPNPGTNCKTLFLESAFGKPWQPWIFGNFGDVQTRPRRWCPGFRGDFVSRWLYWLHWQYWHDWRRTFMILYPILYSDSRVPTRLNWTRNRLRTTSEERKPASHQHQASQTALPRLAFPFRSIPIRPRPFARADTWLTAPLQKMVSTPFPPKPPKTGL